EPACVCDDRLEPLVLDAVTSKVEGLDPTEPRRVCDRAAPSCPQAATTQVQRLDPGQRSPRQRLRTPCTDQVRGQIHRTYARLFAQQVLEPRNLDARAPERQRLELWQRAQGEQSTLQRVAVERQRPQTTSEPRVLQPASPNCVDLGTGQRQGLEMSQRG